MVIDRIDHTHHEIKWTLEASDIYKLKDVKVTVEKRAGGRWFTKWIFCNHRSSVLDPKQLVSHPIYEAKLTMTARLPLRRKAPHTGAQAKQIH